MSRGRFFVATFGCRVNQADSQAFEADLAGLHLERAPSHHDADIVVINTCTVTHRSDSDVRKLVHRIQRDNPAARIVVAGCTAERDPEFAASLEGASAVLGNAHKGELASLVGTLLGAPSRGAPVVVHTSIDELSRDELPPVVPTATGVNQTRPFVKIQDGCDAACTYCVIPNVRGAARSAEPARVLAVVDDLVRQGYFEIVLTGIHLGTYGVGLGPEASLARLVRDLLAIDGLGRLRLSCIEPMAFPLELVDLARDEPRLAPHFHLPLQSGADRVLKRMARPYRAAEFAALIATLRARLPEACIGTDVIVGFPGETDEDFEETRRFVQQIGLDYVHVFSYSDRPGVPSTRLPEKVDPRTIKTRSVALRETAEVMWARFLDARVGRVLSAVTLGRDIRAPRRIEALSADFCPIVCEDSDLEPQRPTHLRVTGRRGDHLLGEPAQA